jgi:acetylornithine deacetylase/succinyl-diaminopimelate desuccinylase-like protein
VSDVTVLLQELIRLDTTNPPGNETLAAELLRAYLEPAGVECELYAREPGRANLVARLRGSGDGPSLALVSHTDVVLADPAEWQRGPFSGDLVDGEVWGRGALDMKGEVAASAVALAGLARDGWRGGGDVIFIAAADEEVGAGFGVEWLCEAHPEAVRADYSVNEGGGDRIELGGRPMYLCSIAEKMTAPFELRVHGRSGHASMPGIADNALVKAAAHIERLAGFTQEPRLIPETEGFLAGVLGHVPEAATALEAAGALDPLAAELLAPLLAATVTPTMVHASDKRNVIPALCTVEIDCRLLPGQTPAEAEQAIRDLLGPGDYELVSAEEPRGGTRSRGDGLLWEAVESFLAAEEPGAKAVPMCVAGFTDSHWLREAFGTVAYGFFPARTMDVELAARLVHSADERVPVSDLELGVRWLQHAAHAVCG